MKYVISLICIAALIMLGFAMFADLKTCDELTFADGTIEIVRYVKVSDGNFKVFRYDGEMTVYSPTQIKSFKSIQCQTEEKVF